MDLFQIEIGFELLISTKILVDVYANSIAGEQLFSYVNNLQSTAFVDVPASTSSIIITPAGQTTPTTTISTSFQPSVSYTVVVFGSDANSLSGGIYFDQFITPNFGNSSSSATSGVASVTTGVASVTTGIINTSGMGGMTSGMNGMTTGMNGNNGMTSGQGVINVTNSAEKISTTFALLFVAILCFF